MKSLLYIIYKQFYKGDATSTCMSKWEQNMIDWGRDGMKSVNFFKYCGVKKLKNINIFIKKNLRHAIVSQLNQQT